MRLEAQHRALVVTEPERLVSNNIKQYTVEFTLTDEWQGYVPVAVFVDTQGRTVEVVPVSGKAVIPWEVLQAAGYLKIGLYGVHGDSIKTTVWTPMLPVEQGTDMTGQQPTAQKTQARSNIGAASATDLALLAARVSLL